MTQRRSSGRLVPLLPLFALFPMVTLARAQTRPAEPFIMREGFNHCWRADTTINVYRQEGAEDDHLMAIRLRRGDLFSTVNVHTYVWPGLVRMLRFKVPEMSVFWGDSEPVRLNANDTVYILNEYTKGFYNVWYRGTVYPVAQFWDSRRTPQSAAILLRRARVQHWVSVRVSQGPNGWVRLEHASRTETDGCGPSLPG